MIRRQGLALSVGPSGEGSTVPRMPLWASSGQAARAGKMKGNVKCRRVAVIGLSSFGRSCKCRPGPLARSTCVNEDAGDYPISPPASWQQWRACLAKLQLYSATALQIAYRRPVPGVYRTVVTAALQRYRLLTADQSPMCLERWLLPRYSATDCLPQTSPRRV
jgi:hypothetical protein